MIFIIKTYDGSIQIESQDDVRFRKNSSSFATLKVMQEDKAKGSIVETETALTEDQCRQLFDVFNILA